MLGHNSRLCAHPGASPLHGLARHTARPAIHPLRAPARLHALLPQPFLDMNLNTHRCKPSVLAAAACLCAAMASTSAAALTLGPIRVQSALGQPLRAEVSITQATPAELAALQAHIAPPDVFAARSMEYSPTVAGMQLTLHHRRDGTPTLRLSTVQPVHDLFIDLVIQASAGDNSTQTRNYTLLLDPPPSSKQTPAVTAAPQVTPSRGRGATRPANTAPRPTAGAASAATRPAPAANTSDTPTPQPAAGSVTVRRGDTASKLIGQHGPKGVSLDQMLVAILRTNPDAFEDGNMNRLKVGAVIKMPSKAEAQNISAAEARQIVAAQSKDFNNFRRGLAANAPKATVQAADRSAAGRVQAQVSDARPGASPADKLTLSKGAASTTPAAPSVADALAQQKQAQTQGERMQELQRNLSEIKGLMQQTPGSKQPAPPPSATTNAPSATAPTQPAPATPASATPAPGITAPALNLPTPATPAPPTPQTPPQPATPAAPPPSVPQPVPASAPSTPTADATTPATAPAAASTAAPAPAAEASAPAPTPSTQPTPAATAASTATPGDKTPAASNSLLDDLLLPVGGGLLALLLGGLGYLGWRRMSQRQPAPFTADLPTDATSTPAAGDAEAPADPDREQDPIAQADAHLAYGHDAQAEEVLKTALRTDPTRLALHLKLAEIYAKHHSLKQLESAARSILEISQGQGPEWEAVLSLGRSMDPTNPFYAAAGAAEQGTPPPANSGFAQALSQAAPAATAQHATASDTPTLDLDTDLDTPDRPLAELLDEISRPATAAPSQPAPVDMDLVDLDLNLDAPQPAASSTDTPPAASSSAATDGAEEDPLATKLDLALEFNTIGDTDGARTLVEEVLRTATGPIKARAEKMLANLGG